jgi:hypothetical protein
MAGKLTGRQEQALWALLREPGVEAAARAAGVGARSLYRWLNDPMFASAYQAARRDALSLATGRLQTAAQDAVTALTEVMKDPCAPPAARVAAARTVLDVAFRASELEDIEKRLANLEAAAGAVAESEEGKRWGKNGRWKS